MGRDRGSGIYDSWFLLDVECRTAVCFFSDGQVFFFLFFYYPMRDQGTDGYRPKVSRVPYPIARASTSLPCGTLIGTRVLRPCVLFYRLFAGGRFTLLKNVPFLRFLTDEEKAEIINNEKACQVCLCSCLKLCSFVS